MKMRTLPAIRLSFVLGLAAAAPGVAADSPITATRDIVYPSTQPKAPLLMPSGAAVDRAQNVYVADGANDRIVVCNAAGQVTAEFGKVADQSLSGPMSVRIDSADRLWIADTGNRRVLIRNPDGTLAKAIVAAGADGGDFTDAVPAPDGAAAWIVDNDGHRVHRFDLAASEWKSFGGQGEEPGRFWYPFSAAVGLDGEVFVVDSINGRIQALTPAGESARQIGRLGLEPGELYRPTAVAVRADGTIWIADGRLGVIQVFTRDGALIDAVRDAEGQTLSLAHPLGLAFDAQGNLYVVEATLNRVQRLRVSTRSTEPMREVASRPETGQPTECLACHVDWIPEFKDSKTPILLPRPATSTAPISSHSDQCLSCHDGVVTDSRKGVWQQHSHRSGGPVPATIHPPAELPLTDGVLNCRTCHTAHVKERTGDLFREAVTVRKPAAALCTDCHRQQLGEPAMHPLPLSGEFGPGESCLICHRPHGPAASALLVVGDGPDAVCTDCHEDDDDVHFTPDGGGHPLGNSLSAEQSSALTRLGRPDFASARIQCLSCHRMHSAPIADGLLAASVQTSDLCIRCHQDQSSVLQSPHGVLADDQKKNALEQTGIESGACGFCHSVHRGRGEKLWAATPKAVDAGDSCTACHAEISGLAKPGPRLLHPPEADCGACHDVHAGADSPSMLRLPEADHPPSLCLDCHDDMGTVAVSLHQPKLLAGYPHADSFCGPCHKIHLPVGDFKRSGTGLDAMWFAPPATYAMAPDHLCTGCHNQAATTDFRVPSHIPVPTAAQGGLPLNALPNSNSGAIGCRTCHLPHGGEAPEEFAEAASQVLLQLRALRPMVRGYDAPTLCSSCHGADGLTRFLYYHAQPATRTYP